MVRHVFPLILSLNLTFLVLNWRRHSNLLNMGLSCLRGRMQKCRVILSGDFCAMHWIWGIDPNPIHGDSLEIIASSLPKIERGNWTEGQTPKQIVLSNAVNTDTEGAIVTVRIKRVELRENMPGFLSPKTKKIVRIKRVSVKQASTVTCQTQGHPTSIFGKYLFGRRFEI